LVVSCKILFKNHMELEREIERERERERKKIIIGGRLFVREERYQRAKAN
jgi:hypothetical protein